MGIGSGSRCFSTRSRFCSASSAPISMSLTNGKPAPALRRRGFARAMARDTSVSELGPFVVAAPMSTPWRSAGAASQAVNSLDPLIRQAGG